MIASKDKITVRQTFLLLFMAVLSPAIRLFPKLTSLGAGKAGWLAPIIAAIPVILLILMIDCFLKKNKDASLADIFCNVLGNVIGKIVLFLYLIWIFTLLSLYIRYYAERILSTIMPNISMAFIIIVMLSIIFFSTKLGIVTIARATEIFFGIFLFVFLFVFVFSVPQFKYSNLLNVSYKDIWPACKSSLGIFAAWGYYVFIFFLGDKIENKEQIKRLSFQGLIVMLIITILLLVMTIGSLGSTLASHVSMPFFLVVKNISIAGTIDHIESVILGLWVITDFIIISTFTMITASLLKTLFNLSSEKSMISPVLLCASIGAFFICKSRFELESFSRVIFPFINVIFEYFIPPIILLIGKIRKKV